MAVAASLLAAAAAVAGWASLFPASSFRARIDSYGRYGGELGDLIEIDGKLFRGEPPTSDMLIEQSEEIPCAIGMRFGVFFLVERVSGPEGRAEFTVRWDHPEIRGPAFTVPGTRSEWPARISIPRIGGGRVLFVGWALDENPQLVPGRWTASILYDGLVLASQDFLLVDCHEVRPSDDRLQAGLRALWGWFRATPAGRAGRL